MKAVTMFSFPRQPLVALVLALAAAGVQAQSWLPPDPLVADALATHPTLAAAAATRDSLQAKAGATRVGSAETAVRVTPQWRQVRSPEPRDNFREGQIAIDRPLRLWGKADADASLADATERSAVTALHDARHELSRGLLDAWFDALRARVDRLAQDAAAQRAEELLRTVDTRVKHGDAARLDLELARADLERLRAAALAARATEQGAVAALHARFPQLTPAGEVPRQLPAPLPGAAAELRERYVDNSHERLLARAEGERAQRAAERMRLERYPDPVVGAFVSVERGGGERVAGLNLVMPLSGRYREANARAAEAEALAATARGDEADRKVRADFDTLWQQTQGNREAARALGVAADEQSRALDKLTKAYALGEIGITELLAAKRSHDDLRYQAERARVEAAHAHYRLTLDLHALWDFEE